LYLNDPAVVEAAVSQKSEALLSLLDEYERDLAEAGPSKFLNSVRLIIRALCIFHREALAHVRANYHDDSVTLNEQIGFIRITFLRFWLGYMKNICNSLKAGTSQYEQSVLNQSFVRSVCLGSMPR